MTYGPIEVAGYKELLVDEDEVKYTDPKCNVAPDGPSEDGTITVPMDAVSGGAGAYMFTLLVDDAGDWIEYDDENYSGLTTGEFTGLPAGTYAVLVEDAENCPSYITEPIVLENPTLLTFATSYLHMSCENMNDGLITITANGGSPDYWYAINNMDTWVGFGAGKVTKLILLLSLVHLLFG